MKAYAHPLTGSHLPATFQGRGVAVPFTTPLLAGARVREASRRDDTRRDVELILPNPSGRRGVYVVQWAGAQSRCHPTVHDTALFRRICQLPHVDPASVRSAALAVAQEGLAGAAAAAAARVAINRDRLQRLRTQFILLAGLCHQVDPRGFQIAALAERTPAFDQWASHVLNQVAVALGHPAAELVGGLAMMGDAFASVGVEPGDHKARVAQLIGRMEATRMALSLWLQTDPANEVAGLGQATLKAITANYDCAATMLARMRAFVADPMALLRRWLVSPVVVLNLAAQCDWLLDGWDLVCSIWLAAASAADRRAAVLEMAQLLPVLPHEVTAWIGNIVPPEAMDEACRISSHNDSWRSGSAAFGLIQRNEALRAIHP